MDENGKPAAGPKVKSKPGIVFFIAMMIRLSNLHRKEAPYEPKGLIARKLGLKKLAAFLAENPAAPVAFRFVFDFVVLLAIFSMLGLNENPVAAGFRYFIILLALRIGVNLVQLIFLAIEDKGKDGKPTHSSIETFRIIYAMFFVFLMAGIVYTAMVYGIYYAFGIAGSPFLKAIAGVTGIAAALALEFALIDSIVSLMQDWAEGYLEIRHHGEE